MKVDNNLDKSELKTLLNTEYALNVDMLTFIPEGEDSYCYLATSRSGEKYFVKAHRAAPSKRLDLVLQLVADLYTRCNFSSVVSPLETKSCKLNIPWENLDVAVFDFIEGKSRWDFWKAGEDFTNEDLSRVGVLIAELHKNTDLVKRESLPIEQFDLRLQTELVNVLSVAEKSNTPLNRHQQELLTALSVHKSEILRTFERFKDLQRSARAMNNPFVITHGDPSPGNIILDTEDNFRLIDWDGIGFGPPEKDLVFFTGERFGPFLGSYLSHFGPCQLEIDLFAFYIYHWALCEIADYGTRILYQNVDERQNEHDWESIQEYVPPDREYMESGISEIAKKLKAD